MPLFKIDGTKVLKINTKDLDLEKNLQKLFEDNLDELLNITFLAHEYSTSFGGRIDTLGIDKNGSPCIIEYKKSQNDNVINQGLSYLRWLLDHKANFQSILASKILNDEIVEHAKVDWDSPRVICIAESYNKFDLDTADILPINIELLKYRLYGDDLLLLEPENYQKVNISTSGIVKKSQFKGKVEKLQKEYSIDDHLNNANENIRSLFLRLREKIVSLDESIKEEPKKLYIAYKLATNFVDVEVRSKDIKIFLNVKSGQLKDPLNLARDLSKPKRIGHWGNGDYEAKFVNDKELNLIFELIRQSYDLNR